MTSHADPLRLGWPRDQVPQALQALAVAAGWKSVGSDSGAAPAGAGRTQGIADLAQTVGLEAELVDVPARRPLFTLRRTAPLLLDLSSDVPSDIPSDVPSDVPSDGPAQGGVLVIVACHRRAATLVGPRGTARVSLGILEDLLWKKVVATAGGRGSSMPPGFDDILPRQAIAAHRVLVAPGLAGRPLAEAWKVRRIATSLVDDLRRAGFAPRFGAVIAAFVAQFALFLAIWRQVGARVLTTHAEASGGWARWGSVLALLGAWVLAQLLASAAVSRLALDAGAVVRVWLLRGALRLEGERIRSAGVGQLLGRALDAEALDVLALGGGVQAVAGSFELVFGVVVLALGAAPVWSLAALALTLAGVIGGAIVHGRRLVSWSRTRREMTHDLVERMVGHRTVLIQDRPLRRQAADDAALAVYDTETRALDRAEVWLGIGLPRAWLLLGLLALGPVVMGLGRPGQPASGSAIAMAVGGVWLVYSALRRLGIALPTLSTAREAWGRIVPMIGAPASGDLSPARAASAAKQDDPGGQACLDESLDGWLAQSLILADALTYQYPGRSTPVLQGVSLRIAIGDRVLIEGASGGGKSTLAALLTGLKVPATGRLRLRGVDQTVIGLGRWRRAVGAAPQFHDNHVLGADLLFNLLMGRRWPPRFEDQEAAERVCRALGLGPLIDRMPAGLQQQVGETGWQLSHGERSRLFVARSMLQDLDARVLDESFAALDPETLDQVMAAVLRLPQALVVIAHP